MPLTDPNKGLDVATVQRELDALETDYRSRKKTLGALLRALEAELPAAQNEEPATDVNSD